VKIHLKHLKHLKHFKKRQQKNFCFGQSECLKSSRDHKNQLVAQGFQEIPLVPTASSIYAAQKNTE